MIYTIDAVKFYNEICNKSTEERGRYLATALITLTSDPVSAAFYPWIVTIPEVKKRKKKEKKAYNSGYTPCFSEFWAKYPKKIAKGIAFKNWVYLVEEAEAMGISEEALLHDCLQALEWQTQAKEWIKDDGMWIPKPENYLLGRRWEDEKPKNFVAKQEEYYTDMDGVRRQR
jgi:hypothetical protein